MTAPANRWKLGLFVIGGCAATISGLTWIGMSELQKATHPAYAYFDEALTGLESGSPVKFRGVTIGVVEDIAVAPDKRMLCVRTALYDKRLTELGLDVTRLETESPFPENLRAQVVMSWVTNTSFIQVDFFPDPPEGPQLVPFPVGANTLRTVPSTAKSLEDASREFLRELPAMALAARELIEMLRTDLQTANIPEISRRVQNVLQQAEQQLGELRDQGTIAAATQAIGSIGAAANSVHDPKGAVVSALHEVQALASDLRTRIDEASLPATTGSVRAAADSLGSLSDDLRQELGQLRAALAALERLASLLERDPGSLLHGREAPKSPLQEKK